MDGWNRNPRLADDRDVRKWALADPQREIVAESRDREIPDRETHHRTGRDDDDER
jgi:hypothetical protein